MKIHFLFAFLLICSSILAQKMDHAKFSAEHFSQEVLNYVPRQGNSVSDRDFNHGVFLLNETKSAVENDPQNFTYADYWNVAMAFINLNESSSDIEYCFNKAIELDPENVCSIIESFGSCKLDERIPERYSTFVKTCPNVKKANTLSSKYSSLERSSSPPHDMNVDMDMELVYVMKQIHFNDVKYRMHSDVDWSAQKVLDLHNQKLIDSLYQKYNTYIGSSLVGDEWEYVMWSVVQHSNVDIMEKYFPVIETAFRQDELSKGPFKMLIDRYYGLKYGYQIFGTQSGFSFDRADEKKRKEIELLYGL